MNEDYKAQLNDVRWLNKRKKVLARAMHKCCKCGYKGNLEVHHTYYIIGHRAWEYPLKSLMALCSKCHFEWHQKYEIVIRPKPWRKLKVYQPPLKRVKPRRQGKKKKKVCLADKQLITRYRRKIEGEWLMI